MSSMDLKQKLQEIQSMLDEAISYCDDSEESDEEEGSSNQDMNISSSPSPSSSDKSMRLRGAVASIKAKMK